MRVRLPPPAPGLAGKMSNAERSLRRSASSLGAILAPILQSARSVRSCLLALHQPRASGRAPAAKPDSYPFPNMDFYRQRSCAVLEVRRAEKRRSALLRTTLLPTTSDVAASPTSTLRARRTSVGITTRPTSSRKRGPASTPIYPPRPAIRASCFWLSPLANLSCFSLMVYHRFTYILSPL